MKILILTGKFGMGHKSAAMAIKEDVEKHNENAEIEIVDIVDFLMPKLSGAIYGNFNRLVGKWADLYNRLNKMAGTYSFTPFKQMFATKIGKLLDDSSPDVIISTLPLSSQYISAYKKMTKKDIALYTYITDICVHLEWIADETNLYFVGSQEVKEGLISHGVDESKIRISGIPVKRQFTEETRVDTGVDAYGKKEVLVMGGGLGLLLDIEQILEGLNENPDVHTTVITGTNKGLYAHIEKKYPNVTPVGYTDRVSEYMRKSDLLITKAGGITTFEAIHCETPMLIISPFLMQEVANARFIEDNNFGRVCWKGESIGVEEIIEMVQDSDNTEGVRASMAEFKNKLTMYCLMKELKQVRG